MERSVVRLPRWILATRCFCPLFGHPLSVKSTEIDRAKNPIASIGLVV